MYILRKQIVFILLAIILQSCSLLGIHYQVQNPKKAGDFKVSLDDRLLGDWNKKKSSFDVNYYDLTVRVIPKSKSIQGTSVTYAIIKELYDTLELDLHPNLIITKLEINQQAVKFVRKESAIYILPKKPFAIGEKIMVEISYQGKPRVAKKPPWKGGFVWKEDKDKNPWIGVACEGLGDGSSLWWAGKDHSKDEPDSVKMTIICPNHLKGISNGLLIASNQNYSETEAAYTWKTNYSINNYNITLYVGNFSLIEDTVALLEGNLNLNYYVLPYNLDTAKKHFIQVKPILKTYEKFFGAYPWMKENYKLIESPYAGMEHQTAIAYGNKYKNDKIDSIDYIILHETAHEWWGNAVSASDLSNAWLHEGFATYAEALYYLDRSGKKSYEDHLWFDYIFIKNKRPLVQPSNIRYFNFKNGDEYVKGAYVLHTLRVYLDNDEEFFSILKSFFAENKMKTIESKVFEEHVKSHTKKDVSWFFSQYLHQRKVPVLEYGFSLDGHTLYYRWIDSEEEFKLPIILYNSSYKRPPSESDETKMKIIPTTFFKKIQLDPDKAYVRFNSDQLLFGLKFNRKIFPISE